MQSIASHGRLLAWARHAADAWQSPNWPALLAALVMLSLLVAFERVVAGAVERGQQQRSAAIKKLNDTWRCKALYRISEREGCLVQLGEAQIPGRAAPSGIRF